MKSTPAKLAAVFQQRAGSKLRGHRRAWRLRMPFAAASVRVQIEVETRLADVRALMAEYTLYLVIGPHPFKWALFEVVGCGLLHAAGKPSNEIKFDSRFMPKCAAGSTIIVELQRKSDEVRSLPAERLQSRGDGGRGFRILIEVNGNRLYETKKAPTHRAQAT